MTISGWNILPNITLDKDNTDPHKDRSSRLWFVFHPVLDVIKDTASKGVTFDDGSIIRCLKFFSNLCSDPSHSLEIFEKIKDFLMDWFTILKRHKYKLGALHWSQLISSFADFPSLIPELSPKYDNAMRWCKRNGGNSTDCSRFLLGHNIYPKRWRKLLKSLEKETDFLIRAELFHENRDSMLRYVNDVCISEEMIIKQKRGIKLCFECIFSWFNWKIRDELLYFRDGKYLKQEDYIYLPISHLNDLIDTFIDHLSRCEEVLEGDVDEEYCSIYLPIFQRILERGSKEKLGGNIALYLLMTLKNISISPSSSTRSSILTLIKSYIRDWLRIYNDSKCYGYWMVILTNITLSSDYSTLNKSLCFEAWPLFHPVLDVVKKEFVGDKIVEDEYEGCLRFFSNLCCDPSHALEVYYNIMDLLDGWFEVIKKKEKYWTKKRKVRNLTKILDELFELFCPKICDNKSANIIYFWAEMISVFSTIPSLVPNISTKYVEQMKWCRENGERLMNNEIITEIRTNYHYSAADHNIFEDMYMKFLSSIEEYKLKNVITEQQEGKEEERKEEEGKEEEGKKEEEEEEEEKSFHDSKQGIILQNSNSSVLSVLSTSSSVSSSSPQPAQDSPSSCDLSIIKSIDSVVPLCIVGEGGLGKSILVQVGAVDSSFSKICVLKRIMNHNPYASARNAEQLKYMQREYSKFLGSSQEQEIWRNCLPHPHFILNLLDETYCGVIGFMMEFCRGGNISEFARSWASCKSSFKSEHTEDLEVKYDPLKIAALGVSIIECVSKVFRTNARLVHGNIKPENFLVRYDDLKDECQVLLGDLGFVEIRDSISRSSFDRVEHFRPSSSSLISSQESIFGIDPSFLDSMCYSAPESLERAICCQKSDAWGVCLTLWSLFHDMKHPFIGHPTIRTLPKQSKDYGQRFCSNLRKLIDDPKCHPRLADSEIFRVLETLEGGKYKEVYNVLLEVYNGLLQPDQDLRLSIHQAHDLTEKIKHLLPRVGEGWKCPSIDEYISQQHSIYSKCSYSIDKSS
ncbi:hypothetical protein ADUPG1_010282 [Aduncisulcus paluster]|uniref:Protein kinase domain-containing protein n=1 Tax=Aduncisulcus paluster TaxID=2918883 RepID=A0ABQ5JQQ4_9EUKA|nr:hypothetical protein ADUPG1_010282 [Aduncisulcus paluster]